jgi:hypothetical protein
MASTATPQPTTIGVAEIAAKLGVEPHKVRRSGPFGGEDDVLGSRRACTRAGFSGALRDGSCASRGGRTCPAEPA